MNNRIPIKIIFLNLEGVLATQRVQFSKLERGNVEYFDPVIVDFLEAVCAKYLCYLVITSKSTKAYDDPCLFKSKMIQRNGACLPDFIFPDEKLWRTTTDELESKGLEIDRWFEIFDERYGERMKVNNYAIIDTINAGPASKHDQHLVCVENGDDGMGCHEYRQLIKILEKD